MHEGFPKVSVSRADAEWINGRADELNTIIETAVNNAPSYIDVEFVNPVSNFVEHELCGNENAFINPLLFESASINPQPESIHPNIIGMRVGYAEAFAAKL
jgi:hypothetical protein